MAIEMKYIKKSYGGQTVLADFSLSIPEGGVCCLMGASGSGKTTVLRILAGLTKPDAGEITGVQGRKVAMVFQENRLLEWADAFANVELVLGGAEGGSHMAGLTPGGAEGGDHMPNLLPGKKKWRARERKAALRAFLRAEFEAVGLSGYEEKPVSQLSGGMKRRIAIVRAVCAAGELLLLDEPFTGLDEETRKQVIRYIKDRTAGQTVVLVTHDAQDAVRMGAKKKEINYIVGG